LLSIGVHKQNLHVQLAHTHTGTLTHAHPFLLNLFLAVKSVEFSRLTSGGPRPAPRTVVYRT